MSRIIKRVSKKRGLPPGTLVYVGKPREEEIKIDIMDYTEAKFQEKQAKKAEDCFPFKKKPTVTWINVTGVHQTDVIEKIGRHFELHPLVLEDIANTNQRPKMEDFEGYMFIVLKMLSYDEKAGEAKSEQVSIILGPNFVISFQEREGDVFDPVRQRIREGKGRIRKMGPDYLAYSLMDAVVDNYFIILERIGDRIEEMEGGMVENPRPETLDSVHRLKRELIFLRKSVWPLREVINNIQRGDSSLMKKQTGVYMRDVYDHTIQVIDTVETFRDMVSGMSDLYLSSISNKMNEVMKVLTIIATIFIPLTFIAGIYGMNFENMPELKLEYAYFAVWAVIIIIAVLMFLYFRRKKWV